MNNWNNPYTILIWIIITIVIIILLFGFIFSLQKLHFKRTLKQNKDLFDQKLKYEQDLKNTIIETQDQERKEIAAEIHDQISNKLNLVLLTLNSNPELLAFEKIKQIKDEIKKLILKNRDISHFLFPIEIENLGLLLTLQDVSLKYRSESFNIQLYHKGKIQFSNKTTEVQLYRVIQEFMSNTLKHSGASEMNIQFKAFKEHIFILITDNGKGFDIEKAKKGLGVMNIDTRLKSINANFKFKSQINKGTSLIIIL